MKPTVYIETTIPSYYWDERPTHAKEIARTKEWWDKERRRYQCFVSPVVLEELTRGNYPNQRKCIELVQEYEQLSLAPIVSDIVKAYHARKLMPQDPVADAFHLALASYYRMDYLLTWNCRHLANATKIRHLESVNQSMGLGVPVLATPYMMEIWE